MRVESQLLDPADDEDTYVQLSLENRLLTWVHYYGILPLEVVRRLRDQLSEHLDTAVPPDEPPDPDQLCPECSRRWGAPGEQGTRRRHPPVAGRTPGPVPRVRERGERLVRQHQ